MWYNTCLNASIKRHRFSDWIKKQVLYVVYEGKNYKYKTKSILTVQRLKKINHTNTS